MVREVLVAGAACFAGPAAGVEGCFQVFPCVREGGEGLVFGAGRAAVRPGLRSAVVAEAAAFGVLAELAVWEGFAAQVARVVVVLLCLLASVADVGVWREVAECTVFCVPQTLLGGGARWHLGTERAHAQGPEADAGRVEVGEIMLIHVEGVCGQCVVAL